MVVSDTDDPSRNIRFIIIDQLNSIYIQTVSPLMTLTIYCYKKKDFGFQHLSPYIKDLSTHDWNRKCRTKHPKQR